MFVLDTDHIGIIQRESGPEFSRLWARMDEHPQEAFYVPIVSLHEQVMGWHAYISRARRPEGVVRGYRMFQRILEDSAASQVLPFDDRASEAFESLRARSTRVATMDLRIAAIAVSNDFVLLSRNTADFSKIPGLKLQDWTVRE